MRGALPNLLRSLGLVLAMSAMFVRVCLIGNGRKCQMKVCSYLNQIFLDTWRDAYEQPAGKRLAFYTTLHGSAFEEAARSALSSDTGAGLAAFASFSAGHWLAPYGRTGTQYFMLTNKAVTVFVQA